MELITEKQHHKISDADESKDFIKVEPSKDNSDKMDVVWPHLRHRRIQKTILPRAPTGFNDNATTLMGRSSTMLGHCWVT